MNNLLYFAQAESAGMTPMQYVFGGAYLLVCLSMIAAILLKTPKTDGFGGMMGGGGGGDFKGAKSKDDTIDVITNWIAIAFIAMSIGLNGVY